jgi:hypothetical protein
LYEEDRECQAIGQTDYLAADRIGAGGAVTPRRVGRSASSTNFGVKLSAYVRTEQRFQRMAGQPFRIARHADFSGYAGNTRSSSSLPSNLGALAGVAERRVKEMCLPIPEAAIKCT